MSEKLVKEALKKYLNSIGAYYYMPVNMGYGVASIDFFVCYKGRFYGIETKKRLISKPTGRQSVIMNAIESSGGNCWIENSTKLEWTRSVLQP